MAVKGDPGVFFDYHWWVYGNIFGALIWERLVDFNVSQEITMPVKMIEDMIHEMSLLKECQQPRKVTLNKTRLS